MTQLRRKSSFKRNIQFSCLIKAGERVREFNFRRSTHAKDEPYFVDVVDEKGERCYFSMVPQAGHWLLAEAKLPGWVLSSAKKLEDAILEGEKS